MPKAIFYLLKGDYRAGGLKAERALSKEALETLQGDNCIANVALFLLQ